MFLPYVDINKWLKCVCACIPVSVQQGVEHASVAPAGGEVGTAEAGVALCRLLAP